MRRGLVKEVVAVFEAAAAASGTPGLAFAGSDDESRAKTIGAIHKEVSKLMRLGAKAEDEKLRAPGRVKPAA